MILFIHDQFKTGPLKHIWRHQNEQNPKLFFLGYHFVFIKWKIQLIIHFYLEHD